MHNYWGVTDINVTKREQIWVPSKEHSGYCQIVNSYTCSTQIHLCKISMTNTLGDTDIKYFWHLNIFLICIMSCTLFQKKKPASKRVYVVMFLKYICHRHGIRVKEKTKTFGCICSNQGFWHGCWQMCRWTVVRPVCMCSGFPARRSKQMIMTSFNDITRISHATLGGNYKRRAHWNLGAVIWVFW